jgi:hypothetical protein
MSVLSRVSYPSRPAPQHVVVAAEAVGGLEAVRHLRGGVREEFRVGVRGGTRLVAGIREQVGGAPEHLHPGAFLMGGGLVDHGVEVPARLGERGTFGGDVAVVEAVERHAELVEELERGGHLVCGRAERFGVG